MVVTGATRWIVVIFTPRAVTSPNWSSIVAVINHNLLDRVMKQKHLCIISKKFFIHFLFWFSYFSCKLNKNICYYLSISFQLSVKSHHTNIYFLGFFSCQTFHRLFDLFLIRNLIIISFIHIKIGKNTTIKVFRLNHIKFWKIKCFFYGLKRTENLKLDQYQYTIL